jgi:plasmid maintenance system antidote protein VapI
MMAKARRLPPVHPGEVLREDLMTPLGLSINALSRDLRVKLPSFTTSSRTSLTGTTRTMTAGQSFGSVVHTGNSSTRVSRGS